MADRPVAVTRAVQLHWAQVGLAVLTTVLVAVLHDRMVESWATGNAHTRELFESGGARAVEEAFAVPAFTPVAVVFCLVLLGLVWVLLAFLRAGARWAQCSLTFLNALVALGIVAATLTEPPWVFVLIAFVAFALELLAVVFLWHRDTRAYVAGTA